jgi:hypothetical protein
VSWHEANQAHLMHGVRDPRSAIGTQGRSERPHADQAIRPPPALHRLCRAFNLSPFEIEILLLCAGVELDGSFRNHQRARRFRQNYPTFGLALAALSACTGARYRQPVRCVGGD